MKKYMIFIVLAFCLVNVLFARGGKENNGNGNIVTSTIDITYFDNISFDSNAHVRFYTSNEYRVMLTTDSNLAKRVGIGIRENLLYVGTKMLDQPKFTQFIVDVYAPSVNNVSISGSGIFEIMDVLNVPSFRINISGNGNLIGKLECDALEVNISGNGKIELEGVAISTQYNVTGTGNIDCFLFQTNATSIYPTGKGGTYNIWALETINAQISGDAKIIYKGNPIVNYKKHYGNGSIEKIME